MLSAFERKVAFKYLFSSKKEGFISFFAIFSFLGIALGVATLIIVMSVMNGFRQNLLKSVIGMRGHVIVMPKNEPLLLNEPTTLDHIQKSASILGAYPMIERQSIVSFQGQTRGVVIQGIESETFQKREPLRKSLIHGDFANFKDDGVIIGDRLAMELGVGLNDRFSVITPEGNQTAFGSIPRQKSFQVAGIFHYGMHIYDKNYIFMPLQSAQNLYKLGDRVSHIDIFLKDFLKAPELVNKLSQDFGDRFQVVDWKHQDHMIFHTVEVERNVMFLILSLIIIIAGFNITSSLIMLVKDKTRAIGILKTLGATCGNIQRIFVSIGLFIGLVGTALGLVLGTLVVVNIESIRRFLERLMDTELFSAEIYYLTKLPAVLSLSDVAFACGIATVLSLVASYIPARSASKLDAIEALRD